MRAVGGGAVGQRAGDQTLVVADFVGVPVVGVRGVEQGDTGVDRGVQGGEGGPGVGASLHRERHRA